MITLNLTDDQAEILGFALTVALRDQEFKRTTAKAAGNANAVEGCNDRGHRIEEVRCLLDAAA